MGQSSLRVINLTDLDSSLLISSSCHQAVNIKKSYPDVGKLTKFWELTYHRQFDCIGKNVEPNQRVPFENYFLRIIFQKLSFNYQGSSWPELLSIVQYLELSQVSPSLDSSSYIILENHYPKIISQPLKVLLTRFIIKDALGIIIKSFFN